MYIMYVDDSGSPSYNDSSKFYVLSGVIVTDKTVKDLKQKIFDYKKLNFEGDYLDAEIHTHDIYKARNLFSSLTKEKKYVLLDGLYDCIKEIDMTIISVGIDKTLMKTRYVSWNLFKYAWVFLTERYDKYIEDTDASEGGTIRIDKSTKEQQSDVTSLVRGLRKHGSLYQSIKNIIKDPVFIDSGASQGIQVADAVAYCTLKYLGEYQKFDPYWKIIFSKLRESKFGKIDGYGFKLFPKD